MDNKFQKAISWSFRLLLFLTPLLMFHKTSEIFEFNKMMFIYLMTLVIGSLWLGRMVLRQKILFHRTPLDLPILLFLIALVLSTLFSIDVNTSIFGYYGRFNGGLLSIISYLILYYAFATNIVKTEIEMLLKTSLLSSLIVILWGLPSHFGFDFTCLVFTGKLTSLCWTEQFRPEARIFSTLGQPNWLGAYLAIQFFIGVYFFIKQSKTWESWLMPIYLILNFIAILLTRSRSTLLALIVGLTVYSLAIFFRQRKIIEEKVFQKKLAVIIVGFLISLVFFKTGINLIDKLISLPFSASHGPTASVVSANPDVTESTDIRKIVWQGGLALGKKYPIFGTGVETFAYAYYFVRPVAHNLTSEWDFIYNKAHNEFINYWATTGAIGLATYLFLILSFLWFGYSKIKNKSWSDDEFLILSLLMGFLTILITNFFGFSTTTVNLLFYLLPGLVILIYQSQKIEKEIPIAKFSDLKVGQRLQMGAVLLLVVAGTIYLGTIYLADIYYARADGLQRAQEYAQAIENYRSALMLKNEPIYHDKLSQSLANAFFLSAYGEDASRAASFSSLRSEAIDANSQALKEAPKNVLYWKTGAKNYFLFYQIDQKEETFNQAITMIDKARELALTDPKIPYTKGLFYASRADRDKKLTKEVANQYNLKALNEVNEAIKLKNNYRDAFFLKGQILKKLGDKTRARAAFEYILNHIAGDDKEAKTELEGL